MIVDAIQSQLAGDLAVAALASAGVFPHMAPQGTSGDRLTYSIDNDEPEAMLGGGVGSLRVALVSVDCWSLVLRDAHALADAVEASLIPLHGQMGSSSPPLVVDNVWLTRRFDLFESDTRLYRVSLQFSVGYYP